MLILQRDPRFIFKQKTSDEVVTNSDVFQNDDDLHFTCLVDKGYLFFASLIYTTSAVADFKYQWVNVNANGKFTKIDGSLAVGSFNTSYMIGGAGTETVINYFGTIWNAIADTEFQLQWAQNTAEATQTIVEAGSSLLVIQL